MARIGSLSADSFSTGLVNFMKSIALSYNVEIITDAPWAAFDSLISALRKKTGKKVVILIDEYDRPLLENLDHPEVLEEVRRVLEEFYQIVKGQEPNERFVFMTGVTKFNKEMPGIVYIFEFKIDRSADAAEKQIMEREYFQKFIERARDRGKEIVCMGMNFSTAERNIVD